MSEHAHIPEGYHSVTPTLTLKNASEALAFYQKAFGAEETFRMPDEKSGKVMHAEIKIGNSTLMASDEFPDFGFIAPEVGKGGAFMIYVDDVDSAFARAIEAGATEVQPVADQFWGDRMGRVNDPYGYRWSLAQRMREVSSEEIAAGAKEWSE